MANPNNPSVGNQYPGSSDPWDSLGDFSGERNINSKTGKPRSFTTFDIYPRRPGETSEEYGKRLDSIREKTAEYQAAEAEKERIAKEKEAREAYLSSEQGQKEAEITAEFDRLSDKLDQAVAEERMSKEHAEALKERQLEQTTQEIAGYQQDYEDRQSVGTPEEQQAYEEWLKSQEESNIANLERRGINVDSEGRIIRDETTGESVDDKEIEQIPDKVSEINELIRAKEAELMPSKISELNELISEKETERISDKISEIDELIGEKTQQSSENSVEIGEIDIKGIEQEFAESKAERLAAVEEKLNAIIPNLGEFYARNRRLVVGAENRAAFQKVKGEYKDLLDEYLKLRAEETHEKGKHEIAEKLESRIETLRGEIESSLTEFAGGNLESSEKNQDEIDSEKARLIGEAEATLRAEYGEMVDALKGKVNAGFLKDFLEQEANLEDATVDKLDNGSLCRKFVNKVINSEALKGVLIGAAVVGLAVSGVGIAAGVAAGTASVGLAFTPLGVAAGAAKGGALGGIMSRQNSKNSAVRGFASEAEIMDALKDINIAEQGSDVANATNWLLEQYNDANAADRSSNRKRTLVAAGIGAAMGALASGLQIGNTTQGTVTTEENIIGYEPTEYHAANIGNVNIAEGHGAYDTFTQMGGDPSNYERAQEIMWSIDAKYGAVPGSNSAVAGFNGEIGSFAHTYPGPIETWPDVAQEYINEVANEWAREGLVPSYQTGGEAIYGNPITETVEGEIIPNAFFNFLTRATALTSAAAAGSIAGGLRGTNNQFNRPQAPNTYDTPEPAATAEPVPASEVNQEPAPKPEPEPEEATPEPMPEPDIEPVTESASETEQELVPREAAEEASPETEQGPLISPEYRNRVRAELGSIVGDEGVNLITAEFPSSLEDFRNNFDRFSNWWDSLEDDQRARVINFERQNAKSAQGSALYNWLTSQNRMEPLDREEIEASQ